MSVVPPSFTPHTPRNTPETEDGHQQLKPISNLTVLRRLVSTKGGKPAQLASLHTFNRFSPLRRLGELMEDPFVTTPPPRQRSIVPRAPARPAIPNQLEGNPKVGGDASPKPRGRSARHRPRKPNGQFAKKAAQGRRAISEDVEMKPAVTETKDQGSPGLPKEPLVHRMGRGVGEAFRRIENVTNELESLRRAVPVVVDVKNNQLVERVAILESAFMDLEEAPALRELQMDLQQRVMEGIVVERKVKALEEDAEGDRVALRRARTEWEGEIARVNEQARDLGWTLEEELAKLKPLVEKHEEEWNAIDQRQEELSNEMAELGSFKAVAANMEHLQQALSQALAVREHTEKGEHNLSRQGYTPPATHDRKLRLPANWHIGPYHVPTRTARGLGKDAGTRTDRSCKGDRMRRRPSESPRSWSVPGGSRHSCSATLEEARVARSPVSRHFATRGSNRGAATRRR